MQQAVTARAPAHVWIIGVVATLWSCFGCYDYLMTRMRNTDYIASSMPGVDPNAFLSWIDGFPIYAQIGWGLGVWMGLLGSILLLLRNKWAVWSYGLSLLGAVISLGYQIVLAAPLAGMEGTFNTVMPYVIIGVCLALLLYARAMAAKGVLR